MANDIEDKKEEKEKQKTIVIFGVSSFIGSNLAEFFKKDFKVIGTYKDTPVSIPGVLCLPCDVLVKEEVQLVLFAFKPDFTIYSVGVSSIYECAKNDELADALNTSGLFNVAEYCQRYKSQICYISSSFVFGGENRDYMEMDIPDANTVYGKTQAAAEFYIQKTSLNYVIFRTCRLYGRGLSYKRPTWFENIQRKLKHNEGGQYDDFIKNGFLDVYYLATIMKLCFEKEVQNRLFQISSSDMCSMYDFTKNYCKSFDDNESLINKGRWSFPIMASATTTGNISEGLFFKLDISNIENFLNIKLPSIAESLEFSFKRFKGNKNKRKGGQSGEGVSFI